jgi:hypothetical protein
VVMERPLMAQSRLLSRTPVNFVAFDLSGTPHLARVPDNIDSKIVKFF